MLTQMKTIEPESLVYLNTDGSAVVSVRNTALTLSKESSKKLIELWKEANNRK